MTRERLAILTARFGAGFTFVTGGWHISGTSQALASWAGPQAEMAAALWIAAGISLLLAGLLAVALTPLFIVRRRALLLIAAATPLSIALLQVSLLGFMPPTALLLLDAALLAASGQLGVASQPLAAPATT